MIILQLEMSRYIYNNANSKITSWYFIIFLETSTANITEITLCDFHSLLEVTKVHDFADLLTAELDSS